MSTITCDRALAEFDMKIQEIQERFEDAEEYQERVELEKQKQTAYTTSPNRDASKLAMRLLSDACDCRLAIWRMATKPNNDNEKL